jgi:DNA-directed RNA polymerase subunit L
MDEPDPINEIRQFFEIAANDTEDVAYGKLSSIGPTEEVPVYSGQGREYLVKALTSSILEPVEIVESRVPHSAWRYLRIDKDGQPTHEFLACPSAAEVFAKPPPTNGERLVLLAFLMLGVDKFSEKIGGKVIAWEKGANNSSLDRPVWRSIMGCSNSNQIYVSPLQTHPAYYTQSQSRLFLGNNQFCRLLSEALTEDKPRWRFFLFYRVLEHGYLNALFVDLQAKFYVQPEDALKDAQNKLKNELEQFQFLVISSHLSSYFSQIFSTVVTMSSSNKFAQALLANLRAKGRDKGTDDVQGVALAYVVRCSIAHAGVRDLYYELYQDADAVVAAILSILENVVFDYLEVT